jgi:hypothetical protein
MAENMCKVKMLIALKHRAAHPGRGRKNAGGEETML